MEGMDVPLSSSALPFSPDEEDVENQLMHIDDQLIRLDGSIDNIEQVRQLSPLIFISRHLLLPSSSLFMFIFVLLHPVLFIGEIRAAQGRVEVLPLR